MQTGARKSGVISVRHSHDYGGSWRSHVLPLRHNCGCLKRETQLFREWGRGVLRFEADQPRGLCTEERCPGRGYPSLWRLPSQLK